MMTLCALLILAIFICCFKHRCVQGCSDINPRKRRELETASDESTKKLLVSRGPLLIKDGDEEQSDAEDGGGRLTSLFNL